ncbi:hypothetical protein MRX96_027701 [Rhipicephalus microplus]
MVDDADKRPPAPFMPGRIAFRWGTYVCNGCAQVRALLLTGAGVVAGTAMAVAAVRIWRLLYVGGRISGCESGRRRVGRRES